MKEPKRWSAPLGPNVAPDNTTDVCVVGSGAGAAPVALTLARAGYRVVVLEKGPAYDQRDFVYDEIRSCRRDFFVPLPSEEPHVTLVRGQPYQTTDGWTANCVGGATVQFSGFTYRLHPEDFQLRSVLGAVAGANLADWPIRYEQLEPYYERAEIEIGISGDLRRNPFEKRRRPLPLPPLPENGFAPLVDAACGKLGLHSYPTPRAILSEPFNGRAMCRLSHFCGSYGCETGAKSSMLVALWPKALGTGRCQIRPRSMVYRVETNDAGLATGVRYFDAEGRQQQLRAKIVIVACSAMESARLLLNSRGKAHPEGVGNQEGLVGQNLLFVGFGAGEAEFSRSRTEIAAIDFRQPFVNRSFQDLYLIKSGATVRKGGTVSFLLPHGNPIYAAWQVASAGKQLLWGKALKEGIRRYHNETRTLEFEVFAESFAHPGRALSLDPAVKDRWGLPALRFTKAQHPEDLVSAQLLVAKGMEVLGAMGAERSRITRQGQQTFWLQGGTCRFGDDAKTSVLDADCRVHSAPNVFVTDGSFMPSSGGVPMTLTIEANSFRVGDRIVALGKTHGLDRIGERGVAKT